MGGSSNNYDGGSYAGGVPWQEYPQRVEPAPFIENDDVQGPAWGPEWANIENTIRYGRTSHEREDVVGGASHDDAPGPSYPFGSTDKESEEDFISVGRRKIQTISMTTR
ncbi:unnamed protein product [Linum trigynum]|uniref:Uncharacterized protein n=1 Tax=Linum trigynum TaxID=586398 RepID=A0AAV2F561_9ROSI